MNPIRHFRVLLRRWRHAVEQTILNHRIQSHNPTLTCDYPVRWRYGYRSLDSIELGVGVHVMAFAEIIVYKHTRHSTIEGRLRIGDGAVISTGANIRAAGGAIRIGRNSGIGEHTVVVAANHLVQPGAVYLKSPWDERKTGVTIGDNVWVGANAALLPGCEIGDNSIIGAGSVVTGKVPPNEIWAGVPARKIRDISDSA